MSYISLLKNIPQFLSQPTGIAAIASLGIHGAVALFVPVNSNKAKDPVSSKAVGVMELSQADQNRLPQTANTAPQAQLPIASQFPLPSQIPPFNAGEANNLPPLPPAPTSSQLVLPPIPKSLDQYRVSQLPKVQSLQIVPRGNFRFDTSSFNANRKYVSSAPRFNDRDIKLGDARPLPIDKLPTLPGAKMPNGLGNSPDVNSAQANQPGNNGSEVAQNEQLIAQIGKTPQAGDGLSLGTQSLPQWRQNLAAKVFNEFPFKPTEQATRLAPSPTTAQVNSYEDLRKTVQQEYPNAEEKTVIRDTIATNKVGLEGTVLGGLVIDADGKVLDIKFQDKSVSSDLRLKAREYFAANPPQGHKKISYYPFSLQFQNNTNKNVGTTQEPVTTSVAPNKPLSNSVVNGKQPEPTATEKPSSTVDDKKDEPVTVVESSKKLIQQLRELRQQKENSDQQK